MPAGGGLIAGPRSRNRGGELAQAADEPEHPRFVVEGAEH
jgi:hypothetical protein